MMILENLQKTCYEDNLAICLKNKLFFERLLPSRSSWVYCVSRLRPPANQLRASQRSPLKRTQHVYEDLQPISMGFPLVLTVFVLELLNLVGARHLGKDLRVKAKILCQMLRPYTKATQTQLEPGFFILSPQFICGQTIG
jgi:hypothetical protein